MKKTLAFLLALTFCFALCACGETPVPAEDYTVRILTLKGPTGMGMAALMEENENKTAAGNYSFTLCSAPTEITPVVIKGDFDMAAVPVNLASVLYNKGAAIQVVAVNTLGVLYILENGNTISSVADLRGKTVYATNKGSTPEYILTYVLEQNGLTPDKDVTVEYVTDATELAAKLAADKTAIGMLPEPSVSAALQSAAANGNTNLRIALDMTEEWGKVCETELAQGCIIASVAFIKDHPKAFETAMAELSSSVSYVTSHTQEASELIAKYEIVPKAAIAQKALPNCNICFITGKECTAIMNRVLQVLYTASPASVGGAMPDSSFYGE